MTFTAFLDIVNEYLDAQGEPYATVIEDQIDPVQRAIDRFVEDTRYFFNEEMTLTLTVGENVYDLGDTSVVSQRIYAVENVWVNDLLIRKVATNQDMVIFDADYATDSNGVPSYWWLDSPTELAFNRKLDSAYSNSRISGYHLHPVIADGNTVMSFEDRDAEAFAVECAITILRPRASGTMLERIKELQQWLTNEKQKIRTRTRRFQDPTPTRRRRLTTVSLG